MLRKSVGVIADPGIIQSPLTLFYHLSVNVFARSSVELSIMNFDEVDGVPIIYEIGTYPFFKNYFNSLGNSYVISALNRVYINFLPTVVSKNGYIFSVAIPKIL